ncbi:predicted protein [Histoplasma capsulatum var. duboisii H88]|uniref:Predicted protein n=1 Tax=Ajellomyces capsulatus (strain H88) TaxID=544711 RepID=F0UDK2_AJEC8|nr:predicted protein [Histoplasma capsulatum var. duboisii H88]
MPGISIDDNSPAVMGRQSYRSSRRDQSRSCRRKGPQLALVQLCAVGLGPQCLYKFGAPPCVPQHVSSWMNAGYYSDRLWCSAFIPSQRPAPGSRDSREMSQSMSQITIPSCKG